MPLGDRKRVGVLKGPGEFAPGIPESRTIHPLPPVPRGQPQQWELATQLHHAEKAGPHTDLRLVDPEGKAHSWVLPEAGLPKPGEKFYLPQTATHTKDYAARKGEFELPEGYGKGKVVGSGLRPIDVHYSEPGKLRFSLLEGRNPQDYALINTPKGWLIHNFSPTAEAGVRGSKGFAIPHYKPDYKEKKTDSVDFDDPRVIHQAKIDGAHVTVHLPDKGSQVRVFSYRPAQGGTGIIEHTHKLPDYHELRTPGSLAGTVLRGELWAAGKDGQALPAERIGGLLNASVTRSREQQEEHGPLRLAVFDVVRHKGKLMEAAPYSEKLEVLRKAVKDLPQLELPETAETPQEKLKLFTRIQEGKEPSTKEGIVAWHLDKPLPTKIKFRPDVDAEVVDVFPGKGKHEGRAGGVVVKLPGSETTTRVGTGFSDQMRKELWERPHEFVGRVAKVEAQQVFSSGKLRAPAFKEFHLEKGKTAAAIHAYISGPSGVGKTTQAGKLFPADQFHHLRSDDYRRIEHTPEGIKRHFDWDRMAADAEAADKPVVIDSMTIHPPLAEKAKHRVLLEAPEEVVAKRRLERGKPMDLDPEETRKAFEYYRGEVKPTAERLGFQTKQASAMLAALQAELDKTAAHTFSHGSREYYVSKLWELAKDLPEEEIRTDPHEFKKNLESGWGKLKPVDVVNDPSLHPGHARRIRRADLSHPVVMSTGGWVADGLHRMAKALQTGQQTVKVKRFRSKEEMEPARIKEASAVMSALRSELNRISHG